MLLILTEKPSARRNFEKALGGREGTFDGVEYRLENLRGHVLGLRYPEEQVPADKQEEMRKWELGLLPWDLSTFSWSKGIKPGCKELLAGLRDALKGVDEVVIATDDDPSGEGELLAWEALAWCMWDGRTSRMYFADEAVRSIQKAFRERREIESMETDGDYVKAVVRERWDFASMQFVRAATCVARQNGFRGAVVRQGRLKSVMVKFIGDQEKAHKEYVRKPFFEARFKDQNGNVFARKVDDVDEIRFGSAEEVDLSGLHESGITEDSRTDKRTAPGKLLDLAGLSAILAKQGHKPESVLVTYQKMYEDQVVSYPRTEDKEVTPEQFEELLPLVDRIAGVVGVDAGLLTHRKPRKSHVKEGGAHGANRPGTNVPGSLAELDKYGKEARDIYLVLAKNYLAMLAEDFEYQLVQGHVTDFPEFVGETKVPMKAGFRAVFDSDAEGSDDGEGDDGAEFADPARPYVHEGANKRPQKPTMKWLNKRLEKFNVGTGATRTSTLAEITQSGRKDSLAKESKGVLSLTDCGKVSYLLLEGCQIADPKVTEELFCKMDKVGRFEENPIEVIGTVTDMVRNDMSVMVRNGGKVRESGLGGAEKVIVGKCPICGSEVILKDKTAQCSSNHYKRRDDGSWYLYTGCGFSFFRQVAGRKLSQRQVEKLLCDGRTGLLKGFKSKKGTSFDAYVTLDAKTAKTGFEFPKTNRKTKGK